MPLTRISSHQLEKHSEGVLGDADLTAIAQLSDSSTGYLAKTGANTWQIVDLSVSNNARLIYDTINSVSGNSVLTLSNTVPKITNGTQIWSSSITPATGVTKIKISGTFTYASSAAHVGLIVMLFRDNTCIHVTSATSAPSTSYSKIRSSPVVLDFADSVASTEETTYSVRVAGTVPQTWYINTFLPGTFGGAMASTISLQEFL